MSKATSHNFFQRIFEQILNFGALVKKIRKDFLLTGSKSKGLRRFEQDGKFQEFGKQVNGLRRLLSARTKSHEAKIKRCQKFAKKLKNANCVVSPKRRKSVVTAAFFAAAIFACAFATAQDGDWYYGKPIRRITFEGLKNVKSADLDGIKSPFIGKPFSDEAYIDLLNRIYSLDYFDDVSPEIFPVDAKKNAIVIEFAVVEKPVVAEIAFVGNSAVKTSELKMTIKIKAHEIFNETRMLVDERAIYELYLKKGFADAVVKAETSNGERGVTVTFRITEGESKILGEVIFSGNAIFSQKTLIAQMQLKTASRAFSHGIFQESLFEEDKQKILAYYYERGYIDARFADIIRSVRRNEKKNRDEIVLTFVIEEGQQYVYAGTTFSGNEIFETQTLASKIKLVEGAPFNWTKMQECLEAINSLYFENGYTSNVIEPVPNINRDLRQISYRINITEMPRSHIEQIRIAGNKKTKDHVILRNLGLTPGDVFSREKLLRGLRNLYNLQFFSAVTPDVVPGSEENLIDLVVTVEEQSTMSLELGLTFSGVTRPGAFPLALFTKWQESNLAGTGKTLGSSVSLSPDTQSASVNYADYWLGGVPLWTSASLSFSHEKAKTLQNVFWGRTFNISDDYMYYEQFDIGLSGAIGYRWFPSFAIINLQAGLGINLQHNVFDKDVFIPIDTFINENVDKWGMTNTISSAISLDGRDVNFDPTKGWFFSERIAWTGLLPATEDQFYMRDDVKLEGYVPLVNKPVGEKWALKMVLAFYAGLSFQIAPKWSYISSSRQLYIDGMFVARGWSSVYNLRGQALFNGYAEYRWSVLPGIIAIDGFFDFAALKPKIESMLTSLTGEDFYFSFGPGVRFCLPQFPLRLLIANTFKLQDGGVEWRNGIGPDWQFVLSFNMINR